MSCYDSMEAGVIAAGTTFAACVSDGWTRIRRRSYVQRRAEAEKRRSAAETSMTAVGSDDHWVTTLRSDCRGGVLESGDFQRAMLEDGGGGAIQRRQIWKAWLSPPDLVKAAGSLSFSGRSVEGGATLVQVEPPSLRADEWKMACFISGDGCDVVMMNRS